MRKGGIKLHGLASGIFHEKVGSSKPEKIYDTYFSWHTEARLDQSSFFVFYLFVFLILLIFLVRLFDLSIVLGGENRDLSENNRIRLVAIEDERGKIFDRNGQLLAFSKRIYFLKKNNEEHEINLEQVADLEREGLAGENFEGELGKIFQKVVRKYPLGKAASHVLGYTSIVQGEDIKEEGRSFQDSVGRLGIEASYDNFLKGKAGKNLIEVDADSRKIAILDNVDPISGRNIHLTVDADLQKVAYETLLAHANRAGSKKGAVIAQSPKTGEILALVSVPAFDGEDIGRYVAEKDQPFFNRVTLGTYPPGSIFKLISALAGLESGKITANTEIEDVGEFDISGTRFSNWYYTQYGRREGILKIVEAIARSNDIFFYRVGQRIGLEAIRSMAQKLGFGQKTGIDLPQEAFGLVPDEVWKKSMYGQDWFLGDTMHLAIGQGFMLTTPVQINSMISFVASGQRTVPFIVRRIEKGDAGDEINMQGKILADEVNKDNLRLVRSGMRQACQTGGTGWPFFDAPYSVVCKTGTAEKSLGNPHAWFSVYAPPDDPQIAMTVLVEEGGEGSSVAGPVAREIFDWYFKNR
ncbi:hypothetical protein HYU92_05185 [Candidatus Curtissbacteria bacterium]|nr:hypothetical protein [Candidatus Curtissbacteria bacterium]